MSKKIGRNDPCPCGSGKKYKKCCLDKRDDGEFSNPENLLKNFKTLRKESRIKQCLYPDHSSCSERIIGAHSIQNNKFLKGISSDGYVYMPLSKPDNPFAVMTKWGRKEATVFTGFCGYHDKTIFQPIEDGTFDKSELHVFLYTYRCFAVEYHKKQEVLNMQQGIIKRMPSLMRDMSSDDSPFRFIKMAVEDFESEKRQFDSALLSGQYDILSSVVWEFPFFINFAGTGSEAPSSDLYGNPLQDIMCNLTLKHVFVMVFSEGDKTYCIISWLRENNELFHEYHQQLEGLDLEQRKNFINNTLPIISENIAVNPDAWDKLVQYKRDEFGALIWGKSELSEMDGHRYDRLEPPLFDLFAL